MYGIIRFKMKKEKVGLVLSKNLSVHQSSSCLTLGFGV